MNTKDFDKKLVAACLTREKFSELTSTPMPTIKNWAAKRNGQSQNCPKWVEAYLNLYIENNENIIHIRKLIKEIKKDSLSHDI